MTRWEYRVVGFDKFGVHNMTVFDSESPSGSREIQTKGTWPQSVVALTLGWELNAIGAEGWELVTKEGDAEGTVWYVFKRKKG